MQNHLNIAARPLIAFLACAALAPASAHAQGTTERVSLDPFGVEGTESSRLPDLSGDGRYVVFETWANLDPADTTGSQFYLDIYLHDRQTNSIEVVSRDQNGGNPNDDCRHPRISADGRYIVFECEATDVWSGVDDNSQPDVFRYDTVTGNTQLVSIAVDGTPGNWTSTEPDVSADGRFVAFTSAASDLVSSGPTIRAVYVRDMTLGVTELISVGVGGQLPNDASWQPALSPDGRYVAFVSRAANLVPGDANGIQDVFVHDRQTGATDLVSLSTLGAQANSDCWNPTLSADGRFVAFDTLATSLVPGDTNGWRDVFLRDRLTGQTTRISDPPGGGVANHLSQQPSLSDDGRYVAFESWATNLSPESGPNYIDVLVYDRVEGDFARATVDSAGLGANGHSDGPVISPDGEYVAYGSDATNLVPNDLNVETDVFVHHFGFELPAPDVAINGSDVALTVPAGTPIHVTCGLDAGSLFGQNADWFVHAATPFGNFWLLSNLQWAPSFAPLLLLQFPLIDFAGVTVLNSPLPAGTYTITFYVDDDADGVFDGTWSDSVSVTVQ